MFSALLFLGAPIASAESEWLRLKMDNIVPLDTSQDIQSFGIGIGKSTQDMGQVEMNVSFSSDQRFDRDTSIPIAWAGSVTNRQIMSTSPLMDTFISFRAGFVAGDRAEKKEDNMVYPFLQLGLGMQIYHHFNQKTYMAMMPEFGFIPGMSYSGDVLSIAAATVAVSVAFGQKNRNNIPIQH